MHLRFHTLVRREVTAETKGHRRMWDCKRVGVDDGGMEQSREWEASGRIPSRHSLGKGEQHATGAASLLTPEPGLFGCCPEMNKPAVKPPWKPPPFCVASSADLCNLCEHYLLPTRFHWSV